jgi:hypothetical protein
MIAIPLREVTGDDDRKNAGGDHGGDWVKERKPDPMSA